ncbi:MAG: CoA transferase [Chloroflexi bacterium]|nr:CoA transferase [Chloroflexota bacterium]
MGLALEGVRILDLTQVYAGPYTTRLLADMGAEVLRIEATMRPGRGPSRVPPGLDIMYPNRDPGEQPYNRFAYYNELNRNKLAISLDLSQEQGKDIFRHLVTVADVVIENFSPRVMPNFGLNYQTLNRLRPDLIMVSLPAFGLTGSYRDYVAYGTGLEGMVGLASMTGYSDGPPLKTGIAYGDPIGGLHAAFAILAALRYRHRTGQGQHIDLALRESLAMVVGEALMDYAMNRRVAQRQGNRHPAYAPHGAYPCRGQDQWIAIAVRDDTEWLALRQAMGDSAWAQDGHFATVLGRHRYQEEIDRHLAEWTRGFEHRELMGRLQGAGVPAAAVLTIAEMVADPQFQSRAFFQPVEHAAAGTHLYPALPWKASRTPGDIRRPPPAFGEHNRWALEELLGLPLEEVSALERQGVIASRPVS